jgi:uncharacterized coiled-coil protein SlyX
VLAGSGAADPSLFDADLKRAVQHFQDRHAIAPDGAVGGITLRELNHTVAERIAELRLNLDRWRWLPNDLGDRYVLVNIAGFELEVVEQGRVIESMNVVVGQQSTETPIFSDSIRFVVVNPYWNVPDGIMERTIRRPWRATRTTWPTTTWRCSTGGCGSGPVRELAGPLQVHLPQRARRVPARHARRPPLLAHRARRSAAAACGSSDRAISRRLLLRCSRPDPDSLDAIFATGRGAVDQARPAAAGLPPLLHRLGPGRR